MADSNILNPGAVVEFSEWKAQGDTVVGQACLNVESTLNALSLEMIDLLAPQVAEWQRREDVAAVVLRGAGNRAFCAGGDIQALYRAIVENHAAGETVSTYPFDFFEREYRLDYQLRVFPKPLIVIGHGVVMGGGLGLFSAASHRLVTPRTRIALPEVTIGLFPDAGGTSLLGSLARHHALFLGMTGSQVNASDAIASGIGTRAIDVAAVDDVLGIVCDLDWRDATAASAAFDAALGNATDMPDPELHAVPESIGGAEGFRAEARAIEQLQGLSPWIDKGISAMLAGCPTTVGIVSEQLRRVPDLSLADTFRLELTVGTHCARNLDFAEGVRALLIDKDGEPKWQYDSLDNVPDAHIDGHFEEPWPAHPLADLGA